MKRCPRLIGRLLPLLIVLSCLSVRATQMEGPTVYEVEPTLAVITDDGSEAYYVDNRALTDLKESKRWQAKPAALEIICRLCIDISAPLQYCWDCSQLFNFAARKSRNRLPKGSSHQ